MTRAMYRSASCAIRRRLSAVTASAAVAECVAVARLHFDEHQRRRRRARRCPFRHRDGGSAGQQLRTRGARARAQARSSPVFPDIGSDMRVAQQHRHARPQSVQDASFYRFAVADVVDSVSASSKILDRGVRLRLA